MTYMKILLLLMFCTVLPMQAQQMKKLTDLKDLKPVCCKRLKI